mmetsp:Transcript_119922/g.208789  ORF Transcript_119922/g.208789 Transcript_119922/m.208789 type:complete len:208 (+) Transcript_119922:1019-1642(+)
MSRGSRLWQPAGALQSWPPLTRSYVGMPLRRTGPGKRLRTCLLDAQRWATRSPLTPSCVRFLMTVRSAGWPSLSPRPRGHSSSRSSNSSSTAGASRASDSSSSVIAAMMTKGGVLIVTDGVPTSARTNAGGVAAAVAVAEVVAVMRPWPLCRLRGPLPRLQVPLRLAGVVASRMALGEALPGGVSSGRSLHPPGRGEVLVSIPLRRH